MIINRAKGGSGWGVQPVALGAPIATLGISAGNCALNGAQYRCAEVGSDSTANAANLVPDAGVSDLGPRFFLPSLNVEPQFPNALSPAQLSSLTIRPLQGLGMGFAATNAVANTTTLTRSNVLGMLTGTYDTWNRIDGTAAGVTVCRRVPGSGTQASYNWYMNNFPCGLGVATGASGGNDPLRMIDSAGGLTANAGTTANPDILNYDANSITVVENSSSGEVRGCLAAANNGGVHNFNDETGRKVRITFPAGAKAIGVLSLDSAGQENGWAFRNAQGAGTFNVTTQASTGGPNTGAAPSQANMKNGAYDFVAEVTGQFRTSVLSGDKLTLTNALFDRLADATILAGISNVGVRNANMGLPVGVNLPNISNANVMLGFRGGNQCAPMAPQ